VLAVLAVLELMERGCGGNPNVVVVVVVV